MATRLLKWGSLVGLLFAVGASAAPAQEAPWGLPPGASTIAKDVDHLYNVILWITGITFVAVEALLLWFCIRYRRRPGGRPGYTHGNNTAEIIWTVSPALILIFIAFYQFNTWKQAKIMPPDLEKDSVIQIQVMARQFEWNFRYRGPDKQFATDDDLLVAKNFYLPIGSTAYMPMRSIDVIHSFYLFQMRVKQDAVPGLRNHVWFEPTGFYVAKIDKTAPFFNQKYRENWRPKDYQKKWEGEYRFQFVKSEQEFQEKFGQYAVAFDNKFQYQDGLFRASGENAMCLVLRNNQVTKVPVREADYVIVPFEGTCAELCGLQHFQMNFACYVVPRAAYDYFASNEDLLPENAAENTLFYWKNWRN